MPITQAMVTSFKVALLNAEMDFSADTVTTFKMALYTSAATLDATTTAYTVTDEVVGTGYTAGGNTLTIAQHPTSLGTTAFLDFVDVTWATATITARGAMIYNADTGAAVAVLDFGADITSTGGNFAIQFPVADATNAILRLG